MRRRARRGVCALRHDIELAAIAVFGMLLLFFSPSPAAALSSGTASRPLWSQQHIDSLPPDVRSTVRRICGESPRAAQYFATYLDNSRAIRLHFDRLSCNEEAMFCNLTGCLRHEYTRAGSHYRLIKAYYHPKDD